MRFFFLSCLLSLGFLSNAQQPSYQPEMVAGHRSYTYQHNIFLPISKSWTFSNLAYFDTEYLDNDRNIYSIRTMLSYNISKSFQFNTAVGMKNPGTFSTVSLQYNYQNKRLFFLTNLGWYYQNGSAMEHFILAQYTLPLTSKTDLYFRGQSTLDINAEGIFRGVQQLRIGIDKGDFGIGLAGGFDQWNNAGTSVTNFGVYIKYFKK